MRLVDDHPVAHAIEESAAAPPETSSPFDPQVLWDPDGGVIDAADVFGRRAPLILEIGTGNGTFLVAEAERHPEADFIGVERSGEFLTKLKKRLQRHGVRNSRCILADVGELFAVGLPAAGVVRVISNFSDPWPKRRHRERRVFRPEFLPLLEAALAPGGSVEFKTDVGWYFNLTVAAFRSRPGWRFVEIGRRSEPSPARGEVVTNFERKAREAGSEVWGFTAVWRDADPSNLLHRR